MRSWGNWVPAFAGTTGLMPFGLETCAAYQFLVGVVERVGYY